MRIFFLFSFIVCLFSCQESGNENEVWNSKVKLVQSEWRDPGVSDVKPYYNKQENCSKILGDWQGLRMVQQNFENNDNQFQGIKILNYFIISDGIIFTISEDDTLMDAGECKCESGVLTVNWERINKTINYTLYFNSENEIELRYWDKKNALLGESFKDSTEFRTKLILKKVIEKKDKLVIFEKQYSDSLHIKRQRLSFKRI